MLWTRSKCGLTGIEFAASPVFGSKVGDTHPILARPLKEVLQLAESAPVLSASEKLLVLTRLLLATNKVTWSCPIGYDPLLDSLIDPLRNRELVARLPEFRVQECSPKDQAVSLFNWLLLGGGRAELLPRGGYVSQTTREKHALTARLYNDDLNASACAWLWSSVKPRELALKTSEAKTSALEYERMFTELELHPQFMTHEEKGIVRDWLESAPTTLTEHGYYYLQISWLLKKESQLETPQQAGESLRRLADSLAGPTPASKPVGFKLSIHKKPESV